MSRHAAYILAVNQLSILSFSFKNFNISTRNGWNLILATTIVKSFNY